MSDRREHDDTFEEPDEHGAEAADDALTRPQPTASRGATARAAREDGVITAGRSARERRRRVLTTFLVVVLGAFFVFWYAYSYVRDDGREVSSGGCTPGLEPSKISVNVYNASTREGAAAKTADQLRARGFVVLRAVNEPTGRKYGGKALLRYGQAGQRGAYTLSRHVVGVERDPGARSDASVDLLIGQSVRGLKTPPPAQTCN